MHTGQAVSEIDQLSKLYYRIGEVSRITGVAPHVLRYWEREFNLRLRKGGRPQRRYQKEDIETILAIKRLLYEHRYTIAGAKKRLQELNRRKRGQIAMDFVKEDCADVLREVTEELREIKQVLD
jgi:DNA-binding transcriptional MerR regulator